MGGQPRLRVFAGPNGSGKSTLKPKLTNYNLGVYVNADEIARQYADFGFLDLETYEVEADEAGLRRHVRLELGSRKLLAGFEDSELIVRGTQLTIGSYRKDNYLHALIADYIRHQLLLSGVTFSFETVLSHSSKITFMQQAVAAGYRTYLYYIATEDPEININRVRNRVLQGLHGVPEDKIVSRYYRSLDLLTEAIKTSSRAFIFDNSGAAGHEYLVASFDGVELTHESSLVPAWFSEYVLKRRRHS
jgi:predicted ABC-type ATPase